MVDKGSRKVVIMGAVINRLILYILVVGNVAMMPVEVVFLRWPREIIPMQMVFCLVLITLLFIFDMGGVL